MRRKLKVEDIVRLFFYFQLFTTVPVQYHLKLGDFLDDRRTFRLNISLQVQAKRNTKF